MEEHVGIAGVGHGAGAFSGGDAPAQAVHLSGLFEPDRAQVIAGPAQIAHRFGANAAGPHIPIGGDMTTGPTGLAGDNLGPFLKDPFGQLVVLGAEGLGEAGQSLRRHRLRPCRKIIGDGRVHVWSGRDIPTHRIEFYPLLGHLGDVRVGCQEL